MTALSLLDLGFHVVATTFTEKGPAELLEASLGRLGELSVLHVDITDDDSVQAVPPLHSLLTVTTATDY